MTATCSPSTSTGSPVARARRDQSGPVRVRPARPARCFARQTGSTGAPTARRFRLVVPTVKGGPDVDATTSATSDARPSVRPMPGRHVDPDRRDERRQTGCTRRVPRTAGHVCPRSARCSASGMQAPNPKILYPLYFRPISWSKSIFDFPVCFPSRIRSTSPTTSSPKMRFRAAASSPKRSSSSSSMTPSPSSVASSCAVRTPTASRMFCRA